MIVFFGAQLFRARACLFVFAALLASFFVGAPTMRAQCTYTQVTGTITDSNNIPYRFGDISVDLVSPGGGNPLCNGRDFPGHQGPTPLDSSGSFALTMPANTAITPGGTQWTFTVHSGATETWEPCSLGPVGFTSNITITGASQSVSSTLSAASKPQNLCGGSGSSGCAITGIPNLSVLSVHPLGTCYGSVDFTWDDGSGAQNLQAGLSNTTGSAANLTFVFGSGNTTAANAGSIEISGDNNDLSSTQLLEAKVIGQANTISVAHAPSDFYIVGEDNLVSGTASASDSFLIGGSAEGGGNSMEQSSSNGGGEAREDGLIGTDNHILAFVANNTTTMDVNYVYGASNILETNASITGINSTHVVGSENTINVNVAFGEADFYQVFGSTNSITGKGTDAGGFGDDNTISSGSNLDHVWFFGGENTIGGGATNSGVYGNSLTITGCSHCYLLGESGSTSTSDFVGMGLSANPELQIDRVGNVKRYPQAFSTLPTCAAGSEGSYAAITDSTTATAGATITGSGTHHVLGYCNGTNWLVAVGT